MFSELHAKFRIFVPQPFCSFPLSCLTVQMAMESGDMMSASDDLLASAQLGDDGTIVVVETPTLVKREEKKVGGWMLYLKW